MAGDPLPTVKKQWASALRLLPALHDVEVSYAWPGDLKTKKRGHVWFDGGRTASSTDSLRAGRRRRKLRCEFDVNVQVLLEGRGNTDRQLECDIICFEIVQAIDEHIADDEHLASAELIDVAWVQSTQLYQGVTDQGVGSRVEMVVGFDARIL